MDFHSMKRKELQQLCKKYNIPANLSNLNMANNLTEHLKEMGKENQKSLIRGHPSLKRRDDNVSETECDSFGNKKPKKVRFSPEYELFEFTRSRELKGRGRRKSVLRDNREKVVTESLNNEKKRGRKLAKVDDVKDIVDSIDAENENECEDKVDSPGRVLRSRRQTLVNLLVNDVERQENRAGVSNSLRNTQIDRCAKKNVKQKEEVSENYVKSVILEPEISLRRSRRNASNVEDESAKKFGVGIGRRCSRNKQNELALEASIFTADSATETKVEVAGRHENVKACEKKVDNKERVLRSRRQTLVDAPMDENKRGTQGADVVLSNVECEESRAVIRKSLRNKEKVNEVVKENLKEKEEDLENKEIVEENMNLEPKIVTRSRRNANNFEDEGARKYAVEGRHEVQKPIDVQLRRSNRSRKTTILHEKMRNNESVAENKDKYQLNTVIETGTTTELRKEDIGVAQETRVTRRSRSRTVVSQSVVETHRLLGEETIENGRLQEPIREPCIVEEVPVTEVNARRSRRIALKKEATTVMDGKVDVPRKSGGRKRKGVCISGDNVFKPDDDCNERPLRQSAREANGNDKTTHIPVNSKVGQKRKQPSTVKKPKLLEASHEDVSEDFGCINMLDDGEQMCNLNITGNAGSARVIPPTNICSLVNESESTTKLEVIEVELDKSAEKTVDQSSNAVDHVTECEVDNVQSNLDMAGLEAVHEITLLSNGCPSDIGHLAAFEEGNQDTVLNATEDNVLDPCGEAGNKISIEENKYTGNLIVSMEPNADTSFETNVLSDIHCSDHIASPAMFGYLTESNINASSLCSTEASVCIPNSTRNSLGNAGLESHYEMRKPIQHSMKELYTENSASTIQNDALVGCSFDSDRNHDIIVAELEDHLACQTECMEPKKIVASVSVDVGGETRSKQRNASVSEDYRGEEIDAAASKEGWSEQSNDDGTETLLPIVVALPALVTTKEEFRRPSATPVGDTKIIEQDEAISAGSKARGEAMLVHSTKRKEDYVILSQGTKSPIDEVHEPGLLESLFATPVGAVNAIQEKDDHITGSQAAGGSTLSVLRADESTCNNSETLDVAMILQKGIDVGGTGEESWLKQSIAIREETLQPIIATLQEEELNNSFAADVCDANTIQETEAKGSKNSTVESASVHITTSKGDCGIPDQLNHSHEELRDDLSVNGKKGTNSQVNESAENDENEPGLLVDLFATTIGITNSIQKKEAWSTGGKAAGDTLSLTMTTNKEAEVNSNKDKNDDVVKSLYHACNKVEFESNAALVTESLDPEKVDASVASLSEDNRGQEIDAASEEGWWKQINADRTETLLPIIIALPAPAATEEEFESPFAAHVGDTNSIQEDEAMTIGSKTGAEMTPVYSTKIKEDYVILSQGNKSPIDEVHEPGLLESLFATPVTAVNTTHKEDSNTGSQAVGGSPLSLGTAASKGENDISHKVDGSSCKDRNEESNNSFAPHVCDANTMQENQDLGIRNNTAESTSVHMTSKEDCGIPDQVNHSHEERRDDLPITPGSKGGHETSSQADESSGRDRNETACNKTGFESCCQVSQMISHETEEDEYSPQNDNGSNVLLLNDQNFSHLIGTPIDSVSCDTANVDAGSCILEALSIRSKTAGFSMSLHTIARKEDEGTQSEADESSEDDENEPGLLVNLFATPVGIRNNEAWSVRGNTAANTISLNKTTRIGVEGGSNKANCKNQEQSPAEIADVPISIDTACNTMEFDSNFELVIESMDSEEIDAYVIDHTREKDIDAAGEESWSKQSNTSQTETPRLIIGINEAGEKRSLGEITSEIERDSFSPADLSFSKDGNEIEDISMSTGIANRTETLLPVIVALPGEELKSPFTTHNSDANAIQENEALIIGSRTAGKPTSIQSSINNGDFGILSQVIQSPEDDANEQDQLRMLFPTPVKSAIHSMANETVERNEIGETQSTPKESMETQNIFQNAENTDADYGAESCLAEYKVELSSSSLAVSVLPVSGYDETFKETDAKSTIWLDTDDLTHVNRRTGEENDDTLFELQAQSNLKPVKVDEIIDKHKIENEDAKMEEMQLVEIARGSKDTVASLAFADVAIGGSKNFCPTAKNAERTILIHGTPNKALKRGDMKENAPDCKRDNTVNLTTVRPAKRRALQDLQWK